MVHVLLHYSCNELLTLDTSTECVAEKKHVRYKRVRGPWNCLLACFSLVSMLLRLVVCLFLFVCLLVCLLVCFLHWKIVLLVKILGIRFALKNLLAKLLRPLYTALKLHLTAIEDRRQKPSTTGNRNPTRLDGLHTCRKLCDTQSTMSDNTVSI